MISASLCSPYGSVIGSEFEKEDFKNPLVVVYLFFCNENLMITSRVTVW